MNTLEIAEITGKTHTDILKSVRSAISKSKLLSNLSDGRKQFAFTYIKGSKSKLLSYELTEKQLKVLPYYASIDNHLLRERISKLEKENELYKNIIKDIKYEKDFEIEELKDLIQESHVKYQQEIKQKEKKNKKLQDELMMKRKQTKEYIADIEVLNKRNKYLKENYEVTAIRLEKANVLLKMSPYQLAEKLLKEMGKDKNQLKNISPMNKRRGMQAFHPDKAGNEGRELFETFRNA